MPSPTSDLNIGARVATSRYRVSAGTGWPGVSIPLPGKKASVITEVLFEGARTYTMSGHIRLEVHIVCAAPSLQST